MQKPEESYTVQPQAPSPAYQQYGQQSPPTVVQQYNQQYPPPMNQQQTSPQHQYYQQQPQAPNGQQPQYNQQPQQPTVMTYQRNDALIAQYQKEIQDNQIGCSDIAWFICCGPFALICCLPKYNAQQRAQTNLSIELAKVN
ncbi:hypothetical protein EMPS_10132 [Entomortierella parvispora]|uniref:Uncharacterized protein n=1 Tax=Entomortierella parvispora TaxID=205924 RepID=A0A9P3HJP7_9FUNG|nr:hypothetical protein EMPS_10132 [Entomortierella parvispora]